MTARLRLSPVSPRRRAFEGNSVDDILYRLVDKDSGRVLLAAEEILGFFVAPDQEPPQAVTFARVHRIGVTRKRTEEAELQVVDRQGERIGHYYLGRVAAVFPTAPTPDIGAHPDLDYSLSGYTCEFPYAGEVWKKWAAGGPEPGEWARQPSEWHASWLHVVQTAWFSAGKRATRYESAGTAVLDGAGITTRDAFYCALGEAVNGTGGYFGSNLDALFDCLRTMRRENSPEFHLEWRNSSFSREALGGGFIDDVVSVFGEFREYGIEVAR
ncbi:Barstar (barnase inhibitor) [Actinobacteria bacterium OK074]|nr:Barstar (barnase inhibitor) [Actinobacteria bacterium OK074]